MFIATRKQREALFKVFQRDFPGWITPTLRTKSTPCTRCGHHDGVVKVPSLQYRRFLQKVVPELCGYGALMVPWKGMWLGIERDGHTHS